MDEKACLSWPSSGVKSIHHFAPHLTSTKVPSPSLSIWIQCRAPAVAASPQRMSPVGNRAVEGQNIVPSVTRQASISLLIEDLLMSLREKGNDKALRMGPFWDRAALSSCWRVPFNDCFEKSPSLTSIDWSSTDERKVQLKDAVNKPCKSTTELRFLSSIKPRSSKTQGSGGIPSTMMWWSRRMFWTWSTGSFLNAAYEITLMHDRFGAERWRGSPLTNEAFTSL